MPFVSQGSQKVRLGWSNYMRANNSETQLTIMDIKLDCNIFFLICKHLFPLLRSGARVVNMSSDSGFLAMIPGETLRNKLKRTDLSIDELDNIMNDFVDSAQAGKHEENGLFQCYE